MHSHSRPHHVKPDPHKVRVILAIKNFAAIPGVCHIGLGVTALNTLRVLRRHGIEVEAWSFEKPRPKNPTDPKTEAELLERRLYDHANDARPVTHVIVSAPSWIQPHQFGRLALRFPNIEFVQLNHSGTSYLSIDKYGIRNIRQVIDLELVTHNVRVAGNNPRFVQWAKESFGNQGLLLPNLYDTTTYVKPIPNRKDHDPLRIGSFGAGRPWKNQLTAAEAAVQLSRRLGVQLELYVNTKRPDGGERMIESRAELFHNLRGAKIIEVPWEPWPVFRKTVSHMDLLFSPSFDETFLVVAADGIAEGVPSVVTGAVEWTPHAWWCDPWDPSSVVQRAMGLIHDRQHQIHRAREKLDQFVAQGVRRWLNYLLREEPNDVSMAG